MAKNEAKCSKCGSPRRRPGVCSACSAGKRRDDVGDLPAVPPHRRAATLRMLAGLLGINPDRRPRG